MEHQEGTVLINSTEPNLSDQEATDQRMPLNWKMTRRLAFDASMKHQRRLRIAQRTAAAAVISTQAPLIVR